MNSVLENPVAVGTPAKAERNLVDILKERNEARETATKLEAERIAQLPIADSSELGVVLDCTRQGIATPEGFKPRENFRLTEAQQKAVKGARKEHQAMCEKEKEERVESAKEGRLTSHQVRFTRGGAKIETLKFEQTPADRIELLERKLAKAEEQGFSV